MTKENLIKDLKNNLKFKKKHSQFDKFPKIFLDNFVSYHQKNDVREWLRFYASLTIEELLNTDSVSFAVGNEQRPQKTLLNPDDLSKVDKKYYDEMLINMFYGEMEDGPLVSIIKGFESPFCSNWLHRFYLINKFLKGEWRITNESPESYGKLKEGKKSISFLNKSINDLKSEYPKLVDKFLSMKVQCKVNVYFSDDLQKNKNNKACHFVHGNDNTSDIQKVHSIESKNNEFIKKFFGGWRYQELIQNKDGSVRIGNTYSYSDIRKQSIFPFVNEKNLKDVRKDGRGYKQDSNGNLVRNRDRGYIYPESKWNDLELFEMGAMMVYQLEQFVNNKYIYNMNLMDDIKPLLEKNKFSFTEEVSQKVFKNFYEFYLTLQDTQALDSEIITTQKLFTASKERISNHFFIWLYLHKLGKFSYTSECCVDGDFAKVYTLLIDYFNQVTDSMLNTDELDFNSHRRSSRIEEGQQKQIDAFKNLLIGCTHEFELENNETVELDLNKEDYLNWGFRFKDPVDKVSNSIKTKARRKFSGCYITGQKILKTQQDAHHIIYHDNGGPTIEKNIWMITDKINRSDLNKFNCTSEYIQYQIDNNPNIFTDERLEFWKNGELKKLKKYENDIENYYWPSL